MNIRERIHAFWAGERPDVIPYTILSWTGPGEADDPDWRTLYENGLGVSAFIGTVSTSIPEMEDRGKEYEKDGFKIYENIKATPVGEVLQTFRNGWHAKYVIETPDDYRVMTWMEEHTRIEPSYDDFLAAEKDGPPHVIPIPCMTRTPIQVMLVDYIGLENFGFHLYEYADEMRTLFEAMRKNFLRKVELVAEGPGWYVEILENFTAEALGPKRFEEFLLPVYAEACAILHDAGKLVGCHYDGKTACCKDIIARAPIDLIESFTPPPEGDLPLDEARAAWPDKCIWSNVNIGAYQLPKNELRRLVLDRVEQGAPDGRRLAFEVSEQLPENWRESMPVVLDALEETRG